MSAGNCPVCLRGLNQDERYCSKLCRQVARNHKVAKVQHYSVPVSNVMDLALRRLAVEQNSTPLALLVTVIQRGFEPRQEQTSKDDGRLPCPSCVGMGEGDRDCIVCENTRTVSEVHGIQNTSGVIER